MDSVMRMAILPKFPRFHGHERSIDGMIERQREDRLRPDLEELRPKDAPVSPWGIGEPGHEFTNRFTRKFIKTELQALGCAGLAGSGRLSKIDNRLDTMENTRANPMRHGYPPDKQPQTIESILKQAELLAENKRKNKAAENPMRGITSAIVPNRIIVPALASKRVNIDGIIAANSEKLSKKQALCLTREFHVDALRAQHEYRALPRRLRRRSK
jgi:hypothetical protein